MKKIAVFCALPPDRNTGMATVDLSAFSVLKRLAPEAEITLYAYGKGGPRSYQPGELPYQYLDMTDNAERYFSSDIFIFWGDFTHTRSYWRIDRAMTEGQFADCLKYIFLTKLPPLRLKDVIEYGSTIITNSALDQADKLYYESFKRFFEGVGAVYFRDVLSAAKISPLRGDAASLGCDCALLLEDDDLKQISGFKPAAERKGVGVFFSASPSTLKRIFFARMVAKYLGEKISWLPWFEYQSSKSRADYLPAKRRHRWPLVAFGLWIKSGNTDTGEILSRLSGYKYIVTDTYHVCVNAWRMGIPAICIGAGAGESSDSLGDKKKEILYEMYGARAFYVFIERLTSKKMIAEAKRAAAVLINKELVSQVSSNILQHKGMALRRLKDAVQKLLL